MVVVCQKCGTENPMGRVFCGNCGRKLEITRDGTHFKSKPEFNWKTVIKFLNWLVAPVMTIVVICTALRYWPNQIVLPKGLEKSQADAVASQLQGIAEMRVGQSATVIFREDDVNAYFKYNRLENLGLEGCRVTFEKGFLELRTRKRVEWSIGKWVPRLSYDVLCMPFGKRLVIRKVSVGHLPLWGFGKKGTVRDVRRIFLDGPEHKLLKDVTGITIEKDEIHVSIKK